MSEEQPTDTVSIQMYVDKILYDELVTIKRNRTWSEFLREDLVLRKPVVDAMKVMKLIQAQEKNSTASIRAEPCEVCGIEFKVTELTELPNSKKLLCKTCFELFDAIEVAK